jgi:hypothetical protein
VTVSNRGTAAASAVAVRISIGAGTTVTSVATLPVGTVGAGAAQTVTTTVAAPAAAGQYTVSATATTTDPESDTGNNTTTTPLTVAVAPRADLVPSGLTLGSATLATGETTSLRLTVANRGAAAARSVAVTVSIASGPNASRIATINVGTLPAGASTVLATTLTAPGSAGQYTVIAAASTIDAESDTTNNTATTGLSVSSRPQVANCSYYASPNGTGNGLSIATPFRISDFWAVAAPGKTLCLLDGLYQGPASLIDPGRNAPGLSGTNGNPITIRALNDGAVMLDGQFTRQAVYFNANSWWVLEGFNARHGNAAGVIYLSNGSSHNVMRRFVAWDATIDANNGVILHSRGSSYNLYEDCAAFGTARKIAGAGQTSVGNTYRRCWFRWEGNTWGSPLAVTMTYNSTFPTFENVLLTWSGESMPQTYTNVQPAIPMTNYNPFAPGGILTVDRIDTTPPKHANINLRGSIVYTKATDRIPTTAIGGAPGRVFPRLWVFGSSSITIEHVVSVMDPVHPRFNDLFGIALTRKPQNCLVKGANCEDPVVNNIATNITSIRGTQGDMFHTDWTVTNDSAGTSLAAVPSPWTATGTGANICFRWGTNTPLWPWPMNERIKAATAMAGSYSGPCPTCVGGRVARTETDVTADIARLLGPIPQACRR